MSYIIVLIGGGLGAALRHALNRGAPLLLGTAFPFATFTVNVLGSFATGFVAAWFLARGEGDGSLRLFFTTGILGGFTTFSAFSLDAAMLWQRAEWHTLGSYVAGSVTLSLAAVFLGMAAARALN